MSARITDDDLLRRKRALRLRIGRSRRRIDGRLHAAAQNTRQLLTWRTYAARYPALTLAAALGAGMAVSAGLKPGRVSRWMGLALVHHALGGIRRQFHAELRRIWTDSTPDR